MKRSSAATIWLLLCAGSAAAAPAKPVTAPDAATLDYLADWLAEAGDPAPDDPVLQLLEPAVPDTAGQEPAPRTPDTPRRP